MPWNTLVEDYVSLRGQKSLDLLERVVKSEQAYMQSFQSLLRIENERGVEKLFELGMDFLKPSSDGQSPLALFAR